MNNAYFQTMMFSAGTYFALPFRALQSTVIVLRGVGIWRMTLIALSLGLKLALTVTIYDTSLIPFPVMVGNVHRGRLIFVDWYLDKPEATLR